MLSLKGLSILLFLGAVVVGKPQFGNPIREDDDYLDYMNVVPQDPQDEVRPANPYDFVHGVKDEKSGNDYSHKAASDGAVTRGEYRVVLPDGRLQIVRYQADKEHGYQADISYENATTDPPQSAEYEK
ncbi:unnamed protein product [Allacma fusca]|uniref:Cuticle protein n=1 Tax=Allacma fusca TaxID=39272 RepID=A0A8J2KKU9_9HEXA|nr:unnamed protein product [Allacma fusca]